MDPDACLAELRKLSARIMAELDDPSVAYADPLKVSDLVDHFIALDLWLSGKGFLPRAWER